MKHSDASKFQYVGCAGFLHDVSAVNFHRPKADVQAICDFLAGMYTRALNALL
jgi:hypothetical protein